MLFEQPLVFVDIETTGGSWYDRVTEVGLVRVDGEEVRETYSTLINPNRRIPSFITEFTGITQEMVDDAPKFFEIAPILRTHMDGALFVAHNVGFDYGFLRREFENCGMDWDTNRFCTVQLSRKLYPEHQSHRLDAVIERHDFDCTNRHRAFDDAVVLEQFFNHIKQEFGDEHTWNTVAHILK